MNQADNIQQHRAVRLAGIAFGSLLVAGWKLDAIPISRLAAFLAGKPALAQSLHAYFANSQLAFGLCLLACAILLPSLIKFSRVVEKKKANLRWAITLLSVLLAAAVQFIVFDGLPHVSDATSHVFQAQIFAAGHFTAPLPPCYEAFYQHNVVMNPNGTWHTKYFPGQALWLTPGFAAHFGGLMMPLGWGLAVWAFMGIVQRLHDERTAILSGTLFACSPMGLLLAGSYMSHTTYLMFALLAGLCLISAFDPANNRVRRAWFLAGIFGAMALLTRPQDMVVWLGPGLALLVHRPIRNLRTITRGLPWFVVGLAPPIAFLIMWDHTLYGAWLTGGYNFTHSNSLMPIIQDSLGFTERHTPRIALLFTLQTLWRFNQALFGWPVSFLFAPFALFAERRLWSMAAFVATCSIVALYALFPYQGFEFEARYYAPALPFLAYLAARGIRACCSLFGTRAWAVLAATAFSLHGLLYYTPAYLWPKYSRDYEQVSRVLDETARKAGLHQAVVLVPTDYPNDFRYSSGFVFNDPWLRNKAIYARDRQGVADCLASAFPDRKLYRFIPDATWGSGTLEPIPTDAPAQSPNR